MNVIQHRREYTRYAAVFSMKYTAKEGKFRDLTRDVGAGGVFISTKRKIEPGRRVNVQFPIFAFETKLSIMGVVVRCESKGFAIRFEEALDVGIFKDGRFPGNIRESKRSTSRIDKHSID